MLAVGYEDSAASVRWQLDQLRAEIGGDDLVVLEGAGAEPLWQSLTEFQAAELGPLSFVANIRPSSVVSFVGRLDPAIWSVQAHAGNGIVRAHALGSHGLEPMSDQLGRLRRLAVEDGGNLVLSRAPTGWKDRLQVWGEPRGDRAIGARVKAALDPANAMNPGRFVGSMDSPAAARGGDASSS